ncbi:MAG: zinc ribbon domain-containing protein [Candidatus Binataceae bacterium]
MRCPSCNYDNPADALFCMKCGTKVENRCPSCNTVNPADANFCRKCGRAKESGASDVSTRSTPAPKTSHIESFSRAAADCGRIRRRAQDGHGAVCRHQGLDGVDGGPRP